MDYIGSILALSGVLLGGSLTYFTNSKLKNDELDRQELRDELKMRRELYSKFLAEANTLALSALEQKSSNPTIFNELSKFTVEIELVASDAVLNKAKNIMEHVVQLHQANWEDNGLSTTLSSLRSEFVAAIKIESAELKKART
ncbi:TPA: hypothetical protein P0E33_004881 [Vibrio harveyi]|nr:hypothetical protein [Vibrio harveyi]HDM8182932.1 hypothetical protein [Vibrio harveyi]